MKVLRDAGLKVVEVPGWRTNNRDHKGPAGPRYGVMLHHTVTSGTASSVALCFRGHSTLPGPLCHGVIDKAGVIHLVGNGRANHAGLGDDDVLKAVISESPLPADNETNTDGNAAFYGFECINLGDGKDPWPLAQIEAAFKASAAICKAHGWSERSVIGHLEWQPGKIDPRGPGWPGMDTARARIKRHIDGTVTAPPVTPPKENSTVTFQYSQVVRETVLTIPAGESRKVYFDGTDVYDEPNQHGDGGFTVITGKRAYHGTVSVWTDPGQPFTVLGVHELADATTSTSSFDQVEAGPDSTAVASPLAGMLPAGRKLHIQIRNDSVASLVLDRVELRLFSEARG